VRDGGGGCCVPSAAARGDPLLHSEARHVWQCVGRHCLMSRTPSKGWGGLVGGRVGGTGVGLLVGVGAQEFAGRRVKVVYVCIGRV
jgi:hypothetical protein